MRDKCQPQVSQILSRRRETRGASLQRAHKTMTLQFFHLTIQQEQRKKSSLQPNLIGANTPHSSIQGEKERDRPSTFFFSHQAYQSPT